jgi:DNA polymerase-3 subunit delta
LTPSLKKESLKPGYVLVGDEMFFRDRFRQALIQLLVSPELREYSIFDEDLVTTPLDDILTRARNSSLMAPVQLFFVRNVRELFGRAGRGEGSPSTAARRKHGAFPENLEEYMAAPNPGSVLVFIADHIHIPVDPRRISLDDKSRLKRIEDTLGRCCEMFVCARVPERQGTEIAEQIAASKGVRIEHDAARALVELLGGDLGLVSSELSKLCTHAGKGKIISVRDVKEMVHSAQQSSAYQLALYLAAGDRRQALEALRSIWNAEGDAAAIPLLYQLSRALKMALVLKEKGVRDRADLYSSLPEGLRPPSFAAEDVLIIARRMSRDTMLRGIDELQRVDVALRSSPLSARLLFEQVIVDLTASAEARAGWQQDVLVSADEQ